MATIINDQNIIQDKINQNLNSSLVDYSEILGSAPTYLNYFNKVVSASTSDVNLDSVYQVVGSNSPIKFNKIESFPVYGIEQISLTLSETEFGAESDVNTTFIILPGTIKPFVDDIVLVPYTDYLTQEEKHAVFQIINVDRSSLGGKRFYKLEATMIQKEPSLVEEQVLEESVFSTTDYEHNEVPILLKSTSEQLAFCREKRLKIWNDIYKKFYDQDSMTICFDHGGILIVDYFLQKFVLDYGLFEFQRYFFNALPALAGSDFADTAYKLNFFHKLINKEIITELDLAYIHLERNVVYNPLDILDSMGKKYIEVSLAGIESENILYYVSPSIVEILNEEDTGSVNKENLSYLEYLIFCIHHDLILDYSILNDLTLKILDEIDYSSFTDLVESVLLAYSLRLKESQILLKV